MRRLIVLAILSLMLLTACGTTRQIKETDYISPLIPPLPAEPAYYPVRWQGYGLDEPQEENAKNLLKNNELRKSYENDLRAIIEGLREGK